MKKIRQKINCKNLIVIIGVQQVCIYFGWNKICFCFFKLRGISLGEKKSLNWLLTCLSLTREPVGSPAAVGAPGTRRAESISASSWRRVVLEVHATFPGLSGLWEEQNTKTRVFHWVQGSRGSMQGQAWYTVCENSNKLHGGGSLLFCFCSVKHEQELHCLEKQQRTQRRLEKELMNWGHINKKAKRTAVIQHCGHVCHWNSAGKRNASDKSWNCETTTTKRQD